MGKDLFDLDDSLVEKKDHQEELKKANILCIREQYDRAIDIYNKILDEDMECEGAYVGLLKAHSECFTKYEGEQIEKDIRVIERMFPDICDDEYISYLKKRKEAKSSQKPVSSKPVEKKKESNSSYYSSDSSDKYFTKEVPISNLYKEGPAPFDIMEFSGYLSEYLRGDGYDIKHEEYFRSVMVNTSASLPNRVQSAEAYGYCCHRREDYKAAIYGYEFAIKHIKSHIYNEGTVFEYIGWIYYQGDGVPVDKEKAKQYWLRGRNEYNNERCKAILKVKFGI